MRLTQYRRRRVSHQKPSSRWPQRRAVEYLCFKTGKYATTEIVYHRLHGVDRSRCAASTLQSLQSLSVNKRTAHTSHITLQIILRHQTVLAVFQITYLWAMIWKFCRHQRHFQCETVDDS